MSKITIGKKELDAEEKTLNQSELLFYEENPRIYSIINSDGEAPSQERIEEILTTMDHVSPITGRDVMAFPVAVLMEQKIREFIEVSEELAELHDPRGRYFREFEVKNAESMV